MKAKLNFLICEVIEWFYLAVPLLSKRGFHLKASKINSVEKPAEHITVLQIPSPVWLGFTKHKTKTKLFYVKGKNSCHIVEASTEPPVWSFIDVIAQSWSL